MSNWEEEGEQRKGKRDKKGNGGNVIQSTLYTHIKMSKGNPLKYIHKNSESISGLIH
jgi:hypothetical protein